jgi:sortase B
MCVASFLIGTCCLGGHYYRATSICADPTETAQERFEAPVTGHDETSIDTFPFIDWDFWAQQNPDVVGWITVPDTGIDCPVVKAPANDPERYLTHDAYGAWNWCGCPYLDADCVLPQTIDDPLGLSDSEGALVPNHVISGHTLNGSHAFSADFSRYSDPGFVRGHPHILIQSPEMRCTLYVTAVSVENDSGFAQRTSFADHSDYVSWWKRVRRIATLYADEESAAPKSLYTFCTCSYGSNEDERTLVFASKG